MTHPPFHKPTRLGALRLACAALATLQALAPQAQAVDFTLSIEPNALVPDADASGLVSLLDVPVTAKLADVNVRLDLTGVGRGAWNGDLFVLLSHDGVASILANRAGRTSTRSFGYGDNGLAGITFDDDGELGDFHLYQEALGATTDSFTPITGSWEPDARAVDPFTVTDAHPRSAFLDVFNGREAGGEWMLFVADLSAGGQVALDGWELQLTFDAGPSPVVPESSRGIAFACAMTAAAAGLRCWRARR